MVAWLIPLVILLPVEAFWLWMFREMLSDDLMPPNIKNTWTIAFIFLNVSAAGWYYFTVYKDSR